MTTNPDDAYFLCMPDDIENYLDRIDPKAYDKTRNYLHGQVTWLSPFLTHGISTTTAVAEAVLDKHQPRQCYRLLFELGWREFFHRTWQLQEDKIFNDMRSSQLNAVHTELPQPVIDAQTDIQVIDDCLERLYSTGLMHNHARMWVAGMVCNMSRTHWKQASRWFHYHLLDGDLASNTLSWQWIAGTFSHKQYVANQANIDKYSGTRQSDTWLDVPYEAFDNFQAPEQFNARSAVDYPLHLPGVPIEPLHGEVALRSLWQLDPRWQPAIDQHILFIDSDLNAAWPMSENRWRFITHWAKACNALICHGTLAELDRCTADASITRAEYPACNSWPGKVVQRDWLYPVPEKSFDSFSQFFKQVKHHAGL